MESIREGIVPLNFENLQSNFKKKVACHYDGSRADSNNPGVYKYLCKTSYSTSLFGAHLAYSAYVVGVKSREEKSGYFERCVQDSYLDMLDQVIMSPEEGAVDNFVETLARDSEHLWNTQMAPRSGVKATRHNFMLPTLPGSAQRSRANSTSQSQPLSPLAGSPPAARRVSTGSNRSDEYILVDGDAGSISHTPPVPPRHAAQAEASPLSEAQAQKLLDSRLAEFVRADGNASSYNMKTTCIPYEYQLGCIAYEQGSFDLNQNRAVLNPAAAGQFIGYLPSDAGAAKILRHGEDEYLYIGQQRTTTTLPFCTLSITKTGYIIYQDTNSKTLYLGREQGNDLQWLKLEFYDDKLGGDVIRYTLSPDGNMIAVLTSNVSAGKLPVNTVYKIALSPLLYERSGFDIRVQARHIFKAYNKDLKNAEQIRDIILLPDQYNTVIILFYAEKHGLYSAKYKLLVMASDRNGGESEQGWGEVFSLPKSSHRPFVDQTALHLTAINDDQFIIYQSNYLQLVEVKHTNKRIRLMPGSELPLADDNVQYCCAAENGTKVALITERGVISYTFQNGLPLLKRPSPQDDSVVDDDVVPEAGAAVERPGTRNIDWS